MYACLSIISRVYWNKQTDKHTDILPGSHMYLIVYMYMHIIHMYLLIVIMFTQHARESWRFVRQYSVVQLPKLAH